MRNFALDLGNVAAEFLNAEVSVIMVFVAMVVMAVLTLNSRTYAEVSRLLLTFLSTMIINKGTYFIFGTISFASNSVLSILQLDFADILCNRFKERSVVWEMPLTKSAKPNRAFPRS